MSLTAKQLGDHGEDFTSDLLLSRGFSVQKLPVNAPTYDLVVTRGQTSFRVSVKVSRQKQHVRLGARKSVQGLEAGNFLFAYVPAPGGEIRSLGESAFTLLILPAELVREGSLAIHDKYWHDRQRDPSIFSVMVKGYDRHGGPTWTAWQAYREAWHLLP